MILIAWTGKLKWIFKLSEKGTGCHFYHCVDAVFLSAPLPRSLFLLFSSRLQADLIYVIRVQDHSVTVDEDTVWGNSKIKMLDCWVCACGIACLEPQCNPTWFLHVSFPVNVSFILFRLSSTLIVINILRVLFDGFSWCFTSYIQFPELLNSQTPCGSQACFKPNAAWTRREFYLVYCRTRRTSNRMS